MTPPVDVKPILFNIMIEYYVIRIMGSLVPVRLKKRERNDRLG